MAPGMRMEEESKVDHWPGIERLMEGMSASAVGKGHCYGICGPTGIGKSFLMRKAESAAERLGFHILRGQAEAGAGPKSIFSSLVPARSEPLTDQLLPSLFGDQLSELSAKRPLLLTLDDMHLADQASVSILILLARNIAYLPAMIVISYDNEIIAAGGADVHPLLDGIRILVREGRMEEMELQKMTRPQLINMVEEELGGPLDKPLEDLIWERSEGNPMIAKEAARLLVQSRQVERRGGKWMASGSVQVDLPEDYQALIKSRLDMLIPDDREILTIAAVAGRTFDPRVIANFLRIDLLDVLERLDQIAHDHKYLADDGERYLFSAGAVRCVLLEDLSPEALMDIHNRIATIMETKMMRDAPFDDLSEHYYMAERADKCACFSLLAGQTALAGGDPRAAISHFQKVLDATEDGGYKEERLFCLEGLADAETSLGMMDQARSHYREVLRDSSAPDVRDRVNGKLTRVH